MAKSLLFTDMGKSCPSHEILISKICLLTLFIKIKFSRKFPNLQYSHTRRQVFLRHGPFLLVICSLYTMLSLKALNFVSETYFFKFLSNRLSIKYPLSIHEQ